MRTTFSTSAPIFSLLALLTTAGCVNQGAAPSPAELAPTAPASWQSSALRSEVRDGWLASFRDPALTALVDETLAQGPDHEAAIARLDAALAAVRQARAQRFPQLGFGSSAFRESPLESSDFTTGRLNTSSVRGVEYALLGASLDLSWELDLWGRLRAAQRGTEARAAASAADLEAVRRSLAGQIAKQWFFAVAAREQKRLAEEFVENFARTTSLVEKRFQAGVVSQQDVSSAKADHASSQQIAEEADETYRSALRGLESLAGRYPSGGISVPRSLPGLPGPVPAGMPSAILERRPDLKRAEHQIVSAFELSIETRAARLPEITLSSGLITSSSAFNTLANQNTSAIDLAGDLFAPLFDAGLRQARVEQADAQQREAMALYRRAALDAFREVEDLLHKEGSLRRQVSFLKNATEEYTKARHIAERRYQSGETDIDSVLTVQRLELEARTNLLEKRADQLTQRVNLHLALGGDFSTAPAKDR